MNAWREQGLSGACCNCHAMMANTFNTMGDAWPRTTHNQRGRETNQMRITGGTVYCGHVDHVPVRRRHCALRPAHAALRMAAAGVKSPQQLHGCKPRLRARRRVHTVLWYTVLLIRWCILARSGGPQLLGGHCRRPVSICMWRRGRLC